MLKNYANILRLSSLKQSLLKPLEREREFFLDRTTTRIIEALREASIFVVFIGHLGISGDRTLQCWRLKIEGANILQIKGERKSLHCSGKQ